MNHIHEMRILLARHSFLSNYPVCMLLFNSGIILSIKLKVCNKNKEKERKCKQFQCLLLVRLLTGVLLSLFRMCAYANTFVFLETVWKVFMHNAYSITPKEMFQSQGKRKHLTNELVQISITLFAATCVSCYTWCLHHDIAGLQL